MAVRVDIVGAGTAGLCAARLLGHAYPALDLHVWGDSQVLPGRAIALSAKTVAGLTQAGVDLARAGQPIRHIHVSKQGAFGVTQLKAQALGLPDFGRVVANDDLNQALERGLPNVTRHARNLSEVSLGQIEGRATSRIVLAAAAPKLLESLQISHQKHPFPGKLWVAEAQVASLEIAYERFTDSGPLALLPLSASRASLVWQRATQPSVRAVNDALAGRVKVTALEHLSGLPAAAVFSSPLQRPGLAVVGNAAQLMHPVAGQGFNLIWRQLNALVKHWHSPALFEREALADRRRWAARTGLLARAFTLDLPMTGLPLAALDAMGPVKPGWVRQFMEGQ